MQAQTKKEIIVKGDRDEKTEEKPKRGRPPKDKPKQLKPTLTVNDDDSDASVHEEFVG